MRNIRLFTITVAVGLAAALSPAAVGVAHAAASHPAASPDVSMWSRPWYKRITASCPSTTDLRTPGALYNVADTGIHIRVSPDGTASSAVSKGTLFASDWVVRGVSGYQCVVRTGGKTWVLGVSESGASGWVRLDYLGYDQPYPVH
jgi:hypothetical protein